VKNNSSTNNNIEKTGSVEFIERRSDYHKPA